MYQCTMVFYVPTNIYNVHFKKKTRYNVIRDDSFTNGKIRYLYIPIYSNEFSRIPINYSID